MKKISILVAALLVLFIGLYSLSPKQEQNVIKIGVLSPLTGGKAQVGEGLKQAILLAQKDFGPTKNSYEFIFEDSGGTPAKSASAIQKLVSIDKIDALISITSQDGNIASKIAEDSKIPHIAIANDHKIATSEYNFVHWTPVDIQSKLFVEQLNLKNIKKVAIFTEINDSSIATVESFKKNLTGSNIEIVWNESFVKETTDFRTAITKMKQTNPELIMLQTFSPSIEILSGQLKELGVFTQVSSITNIGVAKDLKKFEGLWYVSGGLPSESFNSKFKNQTGYDSTIGAHYGYEIAKIYLTIFESTYKTDGETIKNKIQNFDFKKFESVTGVSGIDSDGQFISPASVVIIKNGKNIEIK